MSTRTSHHSLRAFLAFLEETGRLRRVSCPVDKDRELSCIARWAGESTSPTDAYALLFENVIGHSTSVATNVYATLAMYADALGVPADGVLARWSQALAEPCQTVTLQQAPVHERVAAGLDANLLNIPAPTWTPGRDAGPYLSAAAVITKDPATGIQNVGTYRVQIHDGRRAGVFFGSPAQHGAMHYARWVQRGQPMPVALVVGAPPAVSFAAAAKTAYGVDELTIAGGLVGAGVEVVRGRTVDLLVPAHAECVIEGFVAPGARMLEGPFGEALGYMNLAAPAPVMDVTAVCERQNAIHHGYIQQLPPTDGHLLMEMGVLGPLWFYLTRKLGLMGLRDLAISRGSAAVAALVVQLDRSATGRAAAIGRALANLNFGQKFIYLVDPDIDIRDPESLNWAVSSRVDPHRDITLLDNTRTWQLDPSVIARAVQDGTDLCDAPYRSSMAIIDATLKCDVPEISVPGRNLMHAVLTRWDETGLPPITPRGRVEQLLRNHSEDGLHCPRASQEGTS